jgi:hypothetical protein
LLAESLVLSAIGGFCGLLLAWWALGFLRAVVAERLPIQRLEMVGVDSYVLLFSLAASLACGLVFGAVPALTASGSTLTDSLKDGGRSGSASRGKRTRSAFVIVEVALALVLLVGAGLLLRSFVRLLDRNPGFDASRTITMRNSSSGSSSRSTRCQASKRLAPSAFCRCPVLARRRRCKSSGSRFRHRARSQSPMSASSHMATSRRWECHF